jgi:hypothetical protein
MLLRITTLLALALAAGLIAAGCGDDDDETTTSSTTTTTAGATGATGATGEPLSKDEFITQADAICEAGDKKIDAAAQETFSGGQPSQAEQEQFVTEDVVPNIQEQVDGLRALTPPEGDEDEVSAILDSAQDAIDQIESDPGTLTEGANGDDPFSEANQLAKEYGLTVCGQS